MQSGRFEACETLLCARSSLVSCELAAIGGYFDLYIDVVDSFCTYSSLEKSCSVNGYFLLRHVLLVSIEACHPQ
jgi:hypothetical protein